MRNISIKTNIYAIAAAALLSAFLGCTSEGPGSGISTDVDEATARIEVVNGSSSVIDWVRISDSTGNYNEYTTSISPGGSENFRLPGAETYDVAVSTEIGGWVEFPSIYLGEYATVSLTVTD